jgi:hypothetical protein
LLSYLAEAEAEQGRGWIAAVQCGQVRIKEAVA